SLYGLYRVEQGLAVDTVDRRGERGRHLMVPFIETDRTVGCLSHKTNRSVLSTCTCSAAVRGVQGCSAAESQEPQCLATSGCLHDYPPMPIMRPGRSKGESRGGEKGRNDARAHRGGVGAAHPQPGVRR